MKKLITLTLFFAFALFSFAQTATADYYTPSNPRLLAKDRVSASVSMGAGVGFLNTSKNTTYTTFVAPKISYQVSPKFNLNIGLMHYSITGNTFMPLNHNEALVNYGSRTVSGNLLFVGGEYKLNKRLIMSGAVMVGANGFNTNKKDNYKAASLGLEYKVSEHSSIKFETTISEGRGNYYNNSSNAFPASGFNNQLSNGFNNNNGNIFFK